MVDKSIETRLREMQPQVLWQVQELAEVSSTMDVARGALGSVSENAPFVVMAGRQLKGRGRQGRPWFSASGGFAATFAFCAKAPLSNFSGFSLVVGCVLRDLCVAVGAEVGLKWPNDVLSLDGRKLSGVLIELVARGDKTFVLIGIGMNLCDAPPEVSTSTSLFELSGLRFSPGAFLERLAPPLLEAWTQFLTQGFQGFRERWLASALLSGKELAFDTGAGIARGRMSGVDERGGLLLEQGGKVVVVSAGHQIDEGQ